jgi:hypothetical protein
MNNWSSCDSHVFPGEQVERYRGELLRWLDALDRLIMDIVAYQRGDVPKILDADFWRWYYTESAKRDVVAAALAELEAQDGQ